MAKIAKRRDENAGPRRASSWSARKRILDVAEEMVARESPADFQLQEVADRLGVKPPALYNHFRGREDLLQQVDSRVADGYYAALEWTPGEDALTWLRGAARRLVAYYSSRPAVARFTLWDLARGKLALPNDESRERFEDLVARVRSALSQAAQNGEMRSIRPDAFLVTLTSSIAASVLWHEFCSDADVDLKHLEDEAESLVVRLLQPDSGSS